MRYTISETEVRIRYSTEYYKVYNFLYTGKKENTERWLTYWGLINENQASESDRRSQLEVVYITYVQPYTY